MNISVFDSSGVVDTILLDGDTVTTDDVVALSIFTYFYSVSVFDSTTTSENLAEAKNLAVNLSSSGVKIT